MKNLFDEASVRMKSFPLLTFHKGVAHLNGKPRLFISADYPYYRDLKSNWRDRLQRIKNLGIEVVSAYIPWRHHQTDPNSRPDFNGASDPKRDVIGFLTLCAELDLLVIAKPGPFVHAEVNYGGLPDWTCPANNLKIEPLLNADGNPERWSGSELGVDGKSMTAWPLPAPFGDEFFRLTKDWMVRVGREVIQPFAAPNGPIVAVQVGNEGIYSNGQHAPWAFDYSSSAVERFVAYLTREYNTLENYNRSHHTTWSDWKEINPPRKQTTSMEPLRSREVEDWGKYLAVFIAEIYKEWYLPLGINLPAIVNQNPPLEAPYGLDSWLTRSEPERWTGFQYGFTNWVGDVSANPSAFDRYILTSKRFPGINMEENWGFAALYDPAYVDAATSFYQTLAILNNGATGFNIYTGVGTSHADSNMETLKVAPYPDAAPIWAGGEITTKAEIAGWLVKFFGRHGKEFLECKPDQPVGWGLYLPYARRSAWSADVWHGEALREFQRQMRQSHLDYGLVNLETASERELYQHPNLFLVGGEWMDANTQAKLVEYIRGGGRVFNLGQIPMVDENLEVCDLLASVREKIIAYKGNDLAAPLSGVARPILRDGSADIWVRSHPERDVQFVCALIPAHGKPHLEALLELGDYRRKLTLTAAASGGALLRIENGRVTDAIIKGHNGFLGISVPPACRLDDQIVGLTNPGDFFMLDDYSTGIYPS